jgi:hypothetical protein
MYLQIFSIYDSKAEAYLNPFYMKTKGEAVRAVLSVMDDPQHNFTKYPQDFTLFHIGEFDDQKGTIENMKAHENLGNLVSLQESDKPMMKEVI